MAEEAPPLWQVLRHLLDERGMSVRALARHLHEVSKRQTVDNWERTVRRLLDADAPQASVNAPTARALGRALGVPAETFVRPRRTAAQANAERVRELERRVELLEERLRRGAAQPDRA